MSNIQNPRNGGGGGGGTVTSIGGGVGWTPTPDPIVGAGIGNLDIFDLTVEPVIGPGDFLPFYDASAAGSNIAKQRRVDFDDLLDAINAGLLITCAMAPDLLCLDGRTGATNNPLLSTDALGTITGTGSTVVSAGLSLRTSSGPDFNTDIILINEHKTTLKGLGGAFIVGLQNLDIDGSVLVGGLPPTIFGVAVGSPLATWTVVDDTNPLIINIHPHSPIITNPTGQARNFGSGSLFQAFVNYRADAAACTFSMWQSVDAIPQFTTVGGGTLTGKFLGIDIGLDADSGVTLTDHSFGYRYLPRGRFASSVGSTTGDVAFWVIDDQVGVVPGGPHASLMSEGLTRTLLHRGPGVFGAVSPVTNASVALEVQSTTQDLLLSRLTTVQEAAIATPADGMIHYETDLDAFRGRVAGVWVSFTTGGPFQPLDAGLTALSSLGAGIAVSDGADGWFARTIVETGDGLTITNGDGVAGNPSITPANDLAALEALTGTGFAERTGVETWALNATVLTGTGVANRIAFWTGAQTLDDDADLLWDPTTNLMTVLGQILVRSGTVAQIEIISDSGGNANFRSVAYNNTPATGALIVARRARGTEGTPVTLSINDVISTYNAQGYDGTGFVTGGQLRFFAREAWTGSARGTGVALGNIANGGIAVVDRIQLDGNGNLLFMSGVCGRNRGRRTFSNAAFTAIVTDDYVAQVGTMSATRAVTIPTAASAGPGHEITIKDESGTVTGANTITFTMSGGDTTDVTTMAAANASRTIVSNGSNRWGTVATFA